MAKTDVQVANTHWRSSILRTRTVLVALVGAILVVPTAATAQSAEDIAKSLQDPLASISAITLDNTFNLNTGNPDERTGYSFQLQPVYAIPFEGFNFIPRAVIPIVGAPSGAKFPNLGPPVGGGPDDITWGLSDIMLQMFFSPRSEGTWKWGIGPQVSLKTRTDSLVAGPGWGAGVSAVLVGSLGPIAVSALANQHWGDEGDFSLLTIQPMFFYDIPSIPGATIHYNNAITADWRIEGDTKWSVPLGLGVSKSFVVGGGQGLDLALGYYGMVSRPEGGPSGQVKFGFTWVFPR